MGSHSHRRIMRAVRIRLLVLGFGLLVGMILLELGLRLFDSVALHRPRSYNTAGIDDLATGRSVLMYDSDLGWVTTPAYRVEGQRWSQRHNHAGLRAEREHTRTPPAAVRRFAAYGDSSTYCSEVDLEECWTQRLEQTLSNTEVLNFGVPAYGPDQAWLRYRRDGAEWRPCAVLIGHTVENITRVVNRFRPFLVPGEGPLPKPRFIRQGGHLQLLPTPSGGLTTSRTPPGSRRISAPTTSGISRAGSRLIGSTGWRWSGSYARPTTIAVVSLSPRCIVPEVRRWTC